MAANSKFVHSNLAIRYLKAYTEDLEYECKNMEFSINDRVEKVVEKLLEEKPDIIGFSCYIWNIEFITKVVHLVKLIDENIEILYGGPEVTYNPEEFLESNIGEYLIEGEGEESYRELIQNKISCLNKEKSTKKIKGVYIKENNKILYGGQRSLMDMNKIIFPYNENDDLNNKIVYYEASRGCPFNCKYCLSSTIHGVRFLNVERVKKELEFFINKNVGLVKFVDRTFNCNKNYANEIWNFLSERNSEVVFHFEISADLLSKESIDILKNVPKDRFQFEIGVQSTNPTVLKNINRTIEFSNIKEKVKELNKLNNIKQHLDLIAGLPGENYESFVKSFNEVYEINPQELQLGFLKLLKGSAMREEKEQWGMVCSPYPPYEILKTKDITYEEILILKKVEHMVDKYLNSGKFNNIIKFFLDGYTFHTPFEFYFNLSKFYDEKGYFDRNISAQTYYEVFLDFNKEVVKKDELALKNILRYDYLCFNNKRGIPSFLKNDMEKNIELNLKIKLKDEGKIENLSDVTIFKFEIDVEKFISKNDIKYYENFIAFSNIYLDSKFYI